MTSFEIILILVLILAGYYIFLICKEIIRKANPDTEQSKSTEEQEIDITEDLVHFEVTEIDPADILVEDTVIKDESKNTSDCQAHEQPETFSKPILPFPMEVTKFHSIIKNYNPDGPNPELDTILFTVSEKSDS